MLASKFLYTLKIERSNENKLDKDSVALIFQMQSLDKKGFISKIGLVEESKLKDVDKILKEMLKL